MHFSVDVISKECVWYPKLYKHKLIRAETRCTEIGEARDNQSLKHFYCSCATLVIRLWGNAVECRTIRLNELSCEYTTCYIKVCRWLCGVYKGRENTLESLPSVTEHTLVFPTLILMLRASVESLMTLMYVS